MDRYALAFVVAAVGAGFWQMARAAERNLNDACKPGSMWPVAAFFGVSALLMPVWKGGITVSFPGLTDMFAVVLGITAAVTAHSASAFSTPFAQDPIKGRKDFVSEARERVLGELYSVMTDAVTTAQELARLKRYAAQDFHATAGYGLVFLAPVVVTFWKAYTLLCLYLWRLAAKTAHQSELFTRMLLLPVQVAAKLYTYQVAWQTKGWLASLCLFFIFVIPVMHQYWFYRKAVKANKSRYAYGVHFAVVLGHQRRLAAWFAVCLTACLSVPCCRLVFLPAVLTAGLHFTLLTRLLRYVRNSTPNEALFLHILHKKLAEAKQRQVPEKYFNT